MGRVFKPKLKISIVTKEQEPRVEAGQKLTPRGIRNQNLIPSTKKVGTFIKMYSELPLSTSHPSGQGWRDSFQKPHATNSLFYSFLFIRKSFTSEQISQFHCSTARNCCDPKITPTSLNKYLYTKLPVRFSLHKCQTVLTQANSL